jgi:acetylglutamate kinase
VKLLVKIGGTLLDEEVSRRRLARELAEIRARGIEIVVVHGGGKQMTRFLAERGIESCFIGGLRVTTPEVIDAVLKVLAGTVNHELVAAFAQAGAQAVGLSGIDAYLMEAVPLNAKLGAVGKPVQCNPAILQLLCSQGFLPVVACVAGDRQGNIYNVNADQMAVACATGFGASQIHFLTDVDGVRGRDNGIIPELSARECEILIRDGIATGGMQAKLTAASEALGNGIGQVVIAPGSLPNAVSRLLAGETLGTRLAHDRT